MKKILFPTDFSQTSLNAFKYALHLADTIGAEIITLHTYENPPVIYTPYHDFLVENYNFYEWNEFENYRDQVPALKIIVDQEQMGHISIKHLLREGFISDTILTAASEENADYIVMGTKGATGLKEVFLGTVAQRIMNNAKAAVLAIPEGCRYKPVRKILFLTRYEHSNFAQLEKTYALAILLNAVVDVLCVTLYDENKEKQFIKEWKKKYPASDIGFFVLTTNDFEGTVIDFMETHKTDIVVMPKRRKGFFEKIFVYSLSRQLIFHSKIPLLGLHLNDPHEA